MSIGTWRVSLCRMSRLVSELQLPGDHSDDRLS